jgi:hypothetical protein
MNLLEQINQKMHQTFEADAKSKGFSNFDTNAHGFYMDPELKNRWEGWQAAHKLLQPKIDARDYLSKLYLKNSLEWAERNVKLTAELASKSIPDQKEASVHRLH